LIIISFRLTGQFAAFRDPSVTSNQTVYYVPSKSAVIGLLGAMIGVDRDNNSLGLLYGNKYIDFFLKTSIGIRFECEPRKITYFTNHRSFEKATMKPYKKELVQNPQYRIFIFIDNGYQEFNAIRTSIFENKFVYSPYLGHAYCPAMISEPEIHQTEVVNPEDEITTCVILDESDGSKPDSVFEIAPEKHESSVMIERHLHHFNANHRLEQRVLKYWIPVNFSSYRIEGDDERKLSRFYRIDNEVVCMF
jgi:CRISPR-associated protein Cas5h